jgi:Flp pilus assembly protein TadG
MMFGPASAGRFWRRLARPRPEGGGGTVACAAAMPLVVLALAVAADFASVSRFKTRVQLAADAASLAAAEAIARDPYRVAKPDVDDLARKVAAAVFVRHAPRGAAGAPTVAVRSRAAVVTATLVYAGQAPSNFGSALGYDAISVDASASTLPRLADSRSAATR